MKKRKELIYYVYIYLIISVIENRNIDLYDDVFEYLTSVKNKRTMEFLNFSSHFLVSKSRTV